MSIQEIFVSHDELFMDYSWLDVQRLEDVCNFGSIDEFPPTTFQKLNKLTGLNRLTLKEDIGEELKEFADQYENLTSDWRKVYKSGEQPILDGAAKTGNSDFEDEDDGDQNKN